VDVEGGRALWFIAIVAGAIAILWAVPLVYDTIEAHKWRKNKQQVLHEIVTRTPNLSVEEIRQIVSAVDTPPRGAQGLTQSLLGLIIATFVGVALIATLVATAEDSSDLRKTIVTALLSILATVAGFYFGARTAQTAAEQATHPPQPRQATGQGTVSAVLPEVAAVDPDNGPLVGGTTVTVTGTGLSGATSVTFGSAAADVVKRTSDQEIEVRSPRIAEAGPVAVTVTTPGGTSTRTAQFLYKANATNTT
jgi:hypothetical protein